MTSMMLLWRHRNALRHRLTWELLIWPFKANISGIWLKINVFHSLRCICKCHLWHIGNFCQDSIPDSKVHGANMGLTWVLSAPDGPHVGPMNLAIRDVLISLQFRDSTGKPINVLFTAPSVTSITEGGGVNPSLRFFTLDRDTFEVLDFEQYHMPLSPNDSRLNVFFVLW